MENDETRLHPWPSENPFIRNHLTKIGMWEAYKNGVRYPYGQWPDMQPSEASKKPKIVSVKNPFGQYITLDPTRKFTEGDWTTKSYTKECSRCPFYICVAEANKVYDAPDRTPRAFEDIKLGEYENRGLCTFGVSGGDHIRKRLVVRGKIGGCVIPVIERENRDAEKRLMGNFFVK